MTNSDEKKRAAVRERYSGIADDSGAGCCTLSGCCGDYERQLGYTERDLAAVPENSFLGLGCGNPTAIAGLKFGERVLDLGSGAGFDCFLAAEKVGPGGHVIGVDMTPGMVEKARKNCGTVGADNIEFRLGEIEHLPVADSSIDVIISNCVINLSLDKQQVFNEAFRVLKPGGRLAISDVVLVNAFPEEFRNDPSLFSQCAVGAEPASSLTTMLQNAGFRDIEIKAKEESKEFIREWAPGMKIEQYIVSAIISAVKR